MPHLKPRIALVSAPWPLYNRPSVQLGSLKPYIEEQVPGLSVDAFHLYLSVAAGVGYDVYKPISETTRLSEIPYAGLLYPEKLKEIEPLWRTFRRKTRLDASLDLDSLCARLLRVTETALDRIDWVQYPLIGFSICLGQLTSTLWCMREIRRRAPAAVIVAGGSSCAGLLGKSLLENFGDIDYVVSGEGERPLTHLVREISGGNRSPSPHPGLLGRGTKSFQTDGLSQVPLPDELPIPDYDDYFAVLRALPAPLRFIPVLPMEISRGCWWRRAGEGGKGRGCRFCNLNLQWKGYRAKSPNRAAAELNALTDKYRVLSVSFMDNLLPAGTSKAPFEKIAALSKDLRLFGEIRAAVSGDELASMAAAGFTEVQVGIEALSTRLLEKIGKGTTAVMNLEIMKRCETPGMPNLAGNLILQFPGSDEKDVRETLRALDFALPFRPLKAVPFWLGFGSDVRQNPREYGVKKVFNDPFYKRLFPRETLETLTLMVQAYHGGVRGQKALWRPVWERVRQWHREYALRRPTGVLEPILSYRDGGSFCIIQERLGSGENRTHKLEGASRDIFLFCDTARSLGQVLERFPGFGEKKIRPFLSLLVEKRLMFQDGDFYLSLAVPAAPRPGMKPFPRGKTISGRRV